MAVYPNQKVITIRKEKCQEDFLQIKNMNWQKACNNLTYSAFKLYLYMARNQDGYSFALSYEAVNALIPMSRKTYDKAIKELKDNGWLIKVEGNSWIFKDKI